MLPFICIELESKTVFIQYTHVMKRKVTLLCGITSLYTNIIKKMSVKRETHCAQTFYFLNPNPAQTDNFSLFSLLFVSKKK